MKQLLVIRHAKSSWDDITMGDFDRPLNERGEKDAHILAKRMVEKAVKIDAIISSTANRAISTAGSFAKEYGIKKQSIITFDKLYHAPLDIFYEVIEDISDKFDTVAIVAHNPGITEFVNELTDIKIDDMDTCGIYAIQIPIKHWRDFEDSDKNFWFFDSPKS